MGAGLGGGSSDAAAVLLALPVLAGRKLPLEKLLELGACLGSDVPFFLLGGAAVALGRGTELYPLPDYAPAAGLVVAPAIHVSTPEAYRALAAPELTSGPQENIISSFQSFVWRQTNAAPASGENDFESVVIAQHPQLRALKRRLLTLGARSAMLSGSGSALFGLFDSRREAERALPAFPRERVFLISVVSRARYRSLWRRALGAHIAGKVWPPQSRYA
jgi:4-diphosphocytidyl-2-C-methyl-D-erythritol kinase